MDVNTDALVYFLVGWGIPLVVVGRAYWKMSAEDKEDVRSDFSSWRFISTFGFILSGIFLLHAESVIGVGILKIIGIGLVVLGSIFNTFHQWKDEKVKSILVLALLSFAIFLNIK